MTDTEQLLQIIRDALPVLRRAAAEEARANLAPRGLPKRDAMLKLLRRAELALKGSQR